MLKNDPLVSFILRWRFFLLCFHHDAFYDHTFFYCPRQEAGAEHSTPTEADVREGILLPERRQLTLNLTLITFFYFKMRAEQTVMLNTKTWVTLTLATLTPGLHKCYPFGSVECILIILFS